MSTRRFAGTSIVILTVALALALAPAAPAADFAIDWHTIDGGGEHELGGTCCIRTMSGWREFSRSV